MKAAAVACGVALLFLGAAVLGLGQRAGTDERTPHAPIRLREATQPAIAPTPSPSSTMRSVDRYVDHRGLDYYDDHGGRRHGGSGNSNGGSRHGSGDDGSGDDH